MPTSSEIAVAVDTCGTNYLRLLQACGGYYECPKDKQGKRLGPLVAYRGTYDGNRFVGDVYANFAAAERYPFVVRAFGGALVALLDVASYDIDVFCGAPEGGKCLADKLAMFAQRRYAYPEKKDGTLQWGRHDIYSGDRVAIVEDVCNNFSTTEKLVKLILEAGGIPVLITCFLNRSLTVDNVWRRDASLELPVVALVKKKIDQYRQDDPEVAEDVGNDNVVWDVKEGWSRLEKAMRDANST